MAGEAYPLVLQHDAVQNVGLADKVGNEGVLGLVVNIGGGADLLDAALVEHHNGVRHGEGLLLIVGDEHEGDAHPLLNGLQFPLHLLAQLQVEGRQGLVQQQHAGMVDQRAGNGHTLLLAAGKPGDGGLFITGKVDHLEHFGDALVDLLLGHLGDAQAKGDVIVNIQVGKQGVPLENGVDLPLMGRHVGNILSLEQHRAGVGTFKAADDPQGGGLAAAGGAQQGNEFLVLYIKVQVFQDGLGTVLFVNVLQLDQSFSQFTHLPEKHIIKMCKLLHYNLR